MKMYNYKVTFSTYVSATDNYQAVLHARDHFVYSPDRVCVDVWCKGLTSESVVYGCPDHLGTYYIGVEGNDE